MTMHLAQGLSTINTKKPKHKKLTQKRLQELEVQWRQHNKSMRRKHLHDLQFKNFEDYISYIRGEYKPRKKTVDTKPFVPDYGYRRETPNIPSLGNGVGGVATKKEPVKYTGDLIVGIATMHKSNAVPVMRGTDQAKEIANMRRN
mgnify:CR=1 FL=1